MNIKWPDKGDVYCGFMARLPCCYFGYTEFDLLNWITLNVNPGETWIDIGAHYGYTSLAFCEYVGSHGRVFSFEPMVSTAGYLMRTKEINQLRQLSVLPFALGTDGNISLRELPASRGMLDSTLEDSVWKDSFLLTSLELRFGRK